MSELDRGDYEQPFLLAKTEGSGVMVFDFIDEHDGSLRLMKEQHW